MKIITSIVKFKPIGIDQWKTKTTHEEI
jgi:hypothetical protein